MENKLELSYKDKQALYKDILKSQRQILQNVMPSYYNNDINPTMLDNLYFNMRNNIINSFEDGGDINNSIQLKEVEVWPHTITLNTYYPFHKRYKIGHSNLQLRDGVLNRKYGKEKGGFVYINTEATDPYYNLITNNCSDDTRKVLEAAFQKKINPFLFTTPEDMRDFATEQGAIDKFNKRNITQQLLNVSENQYIRALQEAYRINSLQEKISFAKGGYIPSASIKNRIAQWEGSSMYKPAPDTGRVNRSFEEERRDFINALPKNAINKLSQESLDALYSYSYNVGAGNFRKRVVPVLSKYLNGKASAEEVARSMYATKDKQLRGLQKRRRFERNAFYKGATGKDLMGNALNDLTPLQQQNPSTFKTINRSNFNPQKINSSVENIPETTPYLNPQTFIEAIQKQVKEANYGEQALQNVNSNDSYLNAIYNSSINEEKQNINKDIENNEITKYLRVLDNYNQGDYIPTTNIFAEGGLLLTKYTKR